MLKHDFIIRDVVKGDVASRMINNLQAITCALCLHDNGVTETVYVVQGRHVIVRFSPSIPFESIAIVFSSLFEIFRDIFSFDPIVRTLMIRRHGPPQNAI